MLFAAAGQCGCMAILAGTVFDGGHAAGIVATVMLFLFNFFFGVGLLGVAWLCTFRLSAPGLCFNTDLATSTCRVCAVGHSLSIRGISNSDQLHVDPDLYKSTDAADDPGIFTFLVVEITPVSIGNIGYRTYIYFAGMFTSKPRYKKHKDTANGLIPVFNFFFLPLIYLFYPEPRNLTLEQVDRLFTGPKVQLHWDASMGQAGDVDRRMEKEDPEYQHVEE